MCVFNLEGFGFGFGQAGYIKFDVQGGDGPTGVPAGPFAFGPAGLTGYYATQYYTLDPGHYKATLYGKQLPNGALTDEMAKTKVFKVACAPVIPPKPAPIITTTPETQKDCVKGVEGRTATTTTDWTWDAETWAWIKGQPVVTYGDWTKLRDLTAAEKIQLKCVVTTTTVTTLPNTGGPDLLGLGAFAIGTLIAGGGALIINRLRRKAALI